MPDRVRWSEYEGRQEWRAGGTARGGQTKNDGPLFKNGRREIERGFRAVCDVRSANDRLVLPVWVS